MSENQENQAVGEPQDELKDILGDETPQEGQQQAEEAQDDAEKPEEGQDDAEKPAAEEEQPKPKRKSLDARLQDLKTRTWEMREAERRAKEEADRLEKLKTEVNESKRPDPAQYDDDEKYHADVEAYYEKKAELKAQQEAKAAADRQTAQQQQQEALARWDVAKAKAMEQDENFEVSEFKVGKICRAYGNTALAQAITTSDIGTKLVTYLGKDLDEAERIAAMQPMAAARELGKLEAKLSRKPEKKFTRAPAPVESETSGRGAPKDVATMSQAEYNKRRNAGEI